MSDTMQRINPTSREAYAIEGPGIGGNAEIMMYLKKMADVTVGPGNRYLGVGFGYGEDIVHAMNQGAAKVCGVDLAQASIDSVHSRVNKDDARLDLRLLDVSHEPLPWGDDYFDTVTCTETPEHLTNLYFAFAEIKRVLKPGGVFLAAFPDYLDNGGYSGGQHAHIYPNFLTPANFVIFMMQLYFHKPRFRQNGSSSWFVYENYKGGGMVDLFHVVAGNYTEEQLYGMLDSKVVIVEGW